MAGGTGNDTYFVDNAADVVNEAVGGGTDTVFASVSYALTAGPEIEFLRANAGATGLSLTGNEFANTIVGGSGNDTLDGGAGNDTLTGGGGQRRLQVPRRISARTPSPTSTPTRPAAQDLMDISGLGITAATFAASVHIAASPGAPRWSRSPAAPTRSDSSTWFRRASASPISSSPEVWGRASRSLIT